MVLNLDFRKCTKTKKMQKIGKSYIEEELVTTLLGVTVITQSPKESFLKTFLYLVRGG